MDDQQKDVWKETNREMMEEWRKLELRHWEIQEEVERMWHDHLLSRAEIHGDFDEEGLEEDQYHREQKRSLK